jgi:hypothetical protein
MHILSSVGADAELCQVSFVVSALELQSVCFRHSANLQFCSTHRIIIKF